MPIWDGQVSIMGVINPQTRKAWTSDLHWNAEGITNEGRDDTKIVGEVAEQASSSFYLKPLSSFEDNTTAPQSRVYNAQI